MKLHLLKRWEENACLWRVTYKCHGLWRAAFCTSVLFSSNFTSCTLFHSCLYNDDRSLLCQGESESDSIIWYANSLLKWTELLRKCGPRHYAYPNRAELKARCCGNSLKSVPLPDNIFGDGTEPTKLRDGDHLWSTLIKTCPSRNTDPTDVVVLPSFVSLPLLERTSQKISIN